MTEARTKIIGKRVSTQKPNKRVQLSDSVLQRRSGQAPLVFRLEFEGALGSIASSFLDIVCFVELQSCGSIQFRLPAWRFVLEGQAVEHLR
jgi:hypothetical protein